MITREQGFQLKEIAEYVNEQLSMMGLQLEDKASAKKFISDIIADT